MLPQETDRILSEYIQRGIVSPRQIEDIQVMHGLSDPQVEDPVSTLVAHSVYMLDDEKAELSNNH